MSTLPSDDPQCEVTAVRAFCTRQWQLGLHLTGRDAERFHFLLTPQALASLEHQLAAYRQLRAEQQAEALRPSTP